MNRPPTQTGIHFAREWGIRRPYVYRYLDKTYVDEFFSSGRLRISSFDQFSRHTDEARFDGQEGQGHVSHQDHLGEGHMVYGFVSQGSGSYVFCGSSVFDRSIADQFAADSGFRINDTIAFADAIAHRISGFSGGCEGPCIYLPSRTVSRDVGKVEFSSFLDDSDPSKVSGDKLMGFIGAMSGDDPLFLKESKYSSQCEYRFVWHTHDPKVRGFVDIEVPEARQFCTRFEELRT